jgi:FtsP/CotA-like multicopper oxidase with cupredoxin domain
MQRSAESATTPYLMGGYVMLALLILAATATTLDAQTAELTFDMRLQDGRVPESMQLIRVKQGDVVTLRWTVNRPLLLHLHGYDIQWRAQPGTVGSVTFTARLTGRFPIHAHAMATGADDHAHEDSPLAYVEVYPR